jgi:hypothetical protein
MLAPPCRAAEAASHNGTEPPSRRVRGSGALGPPRGRAPATGGRRRPYCARGRSSARAPGMRLSTAGEGPPPACCGVLPAGGGPRVRDTSRGMHELIGQHRNGGRGHTGSGTPGLGLDRPLAGRAGRDGRRSGTHRRLGRLAPQPGRLAAQLGRLGPTRCDDRPVLANAGLAGRPLAAPRSARGGLGRRRALAWLAACRPVQLAPDALAPDTLATGDRAASCRAPAGATA